VDLQLTQLKEDIEERYCEQSIVYTLNSIYYKLSASFVCVFALCLYLNFYKRNYMKCKNTLYTNALDIITCANKQSTNL